MQYNMNDQHDYAVQLDLPNLIVTKQHFKVELYQAHALVIGRATHG